MQYSNPFADPRNLVQHPTREMLEADIRRLQAEVQELRDQVFQLEAELDAARSEC